MTCRNCGSETVGMFCPNCGQASSTDRFTIRRIGVDIVKTLTQTDRGIWPLIRDLSIRPAGMIRGYLEGRRKQYFGPLPYLIVTTTVSSFLAMQFSLMSASAADADPVQAQFGDFIMRHFNMTVFFTIPLQACSTRWLFRRSDLNIAEHVVANTFLSAHRSAFYIVFAAPLTVLFRDDFMIVAGIYTLIWMVYFTVVYVKLFRQKWLAGIAKSLIAISIMYAVYYFALLSGFLLFRQS